MLCYYGALFLSFMIVWLEATYTKNDDLGAAAKVCPIAEAGAADRPYKWYFAEILLAAACTSSFSVRRYSLW